MPAADTEKVRLKSPTTPARPWFLYVVKCSSDTLYTGISTDVQRRFAEHENKDGKNKGAKALRGKTPLNLVFQIVVGNRSDALKLEYKVKQLSRAQKEELIGLDADLVEFETWLQTRQ